ncbi:hypothetical protein OG350_37750 [Streptomyces achromogenes]|uniref:Uncharacterized protein n=2 Tax=Streptomyces achromogenes TaxID=67255 RepID=A0ABZ1L025_STRAH
MWGGRRIAVTVAAGLVIVSTPVFWLLDGPDTGQLVGASVQAATGVGALVWAWIQPAAEALDSAVRTGRAEASGGGRAHTGIRRRGAGGSGAARVQQSGDALARGQGSGAGTGIEYTG